MKFFVVNIAFMLIYFPESGGSFNLRYVSTQGRQDGLLKIKMGLAEFNIH